MRVVLKCFYPSQVWRIEKLELAEVKPNLYGQFYGGDCYLVLYTYHVSNRKQYLLYIWQVGLSSALKLFILSPNKLTLHDDSLTSGTSRHEGRDHGERLSGRHSRQHVQRSPRPGPSGHGEGASPLSGYIQRETHHFWGAFFFFHKRRFLSECITEWKSVSFVCASSGRNGSTRCS